MATEIERATLRTPHEVATYANCGVRQIRAAVRDGSLPTLRLGKFRLARIEAIDGWLKSLETKGVKPSTTRAHIARLGDNTRAAKKAKVSR